MTPAQPKKPFTAQTARTWGTRFDSLETSPPSSPHALEDCRSVPPKSPGGFDRDSQEFSHRPRDKMPHDASVFVGSLPTNIDESELTHLLSDHLSGYAEVKSIKVIRDARGGVCAFVQCEDGAGAANLIQTLQSAPSELFMGRMLRFEPARAFRTLLISYRTPTRVVHSSNPPGDSPALDQSHEGTRVELEPADAMRIWRPRGSRYLSLLYKSEARDFDITQANDAIAARTGEQHREHVRESTMVDPFSGSGIFISPLRYDEETIRHIASAFGPLEYVSVHKRSLTAQAGEDPMGTNEENGDDERTAPTYSPPHDAPRSVGMDPRCWEVKWEHRDNCVTALTTLRRVPHLTVTWAHQPQPQSRWDQANSPSMRSPYVGSPYAHHTQSPRAHYHYLPTTYGSPRRFSAPLTPREEQGRSVLSPSREPTVAAEERNGLTSSSTTPLMSVSSIGSDRSWTIVPHTRTGLSSGALGLPAEGEGRRTEWTENDFPPLAVGMPNGERSPLVGTGIWVERRSATTENLDEPELTSTISSTPDLSTSPLTPKTPIQPFIPGTQTEHQHLDIAPSAHGSSPRTHVSPSSRYHTSYGIGLDRLSIFIGGLDMFGQHAWDEEKVRIVFGRFGEIETVAFVRPREPVHNKAAFAFVKYLSSEAAARAVAEEHNRLYAGRPIRVQLRDHNAAHRAAAKSIRGGRGRYYGPPFHRHDFRNGGILGLDVGDAEASNAPHSQEGQTPAVVNEDEGGVQEYSIPDETRTDAELVTPTVGIEQHAEHRSTALAMRVTNDKQETEALTPPQDHDVTVPLFESGSTSPAVESPEDRSPEHGESAVTFATLAPYSSSDAGTGVDAHSSLTNTSYPPHTWMQVMAHQFPYPIPFGVGYPGFPMAQPPTAPFYSAPPSADAGGVAGGAQNPWAAYTNMYKPYSIPYNPYPLLPTNAEPLQTNAQPQQNGQGNQPPLWPTGFIQSEQGTLIPVYHPEALDQYMTTNQQQQASSSTMQPGIAWQQYPSNTTGYPYPMAVSQMTVSPAIQQAQIHHAVHGPHLATSGVWGPAAQSGAYPMVMSNMQQAVSTPVQYPYIDSSNPAHQASGYFGHGFAQQQFDHRNPQLSQKRNQRRENQGGYIANRNANNKTSPSRLGRVSLSHSDPTIVASSGSSGPGVQSQSQFSAMRPASLPTQPAFIGTPATNEWTQWAAGR